MADEAKSNATIVGVIIVEYASVERPLVKRAHRLTTRVNCGQRLKLLSLRDRNEMLMPSHVRS